MVVHREPSIEICLKNARQALLDATTVREPLLLLLSGGSCLDLLTNTFFDHLPEDTVIFPLDERVTSQAEETNVWKIAQRMPAHMRSRFYECGAHTDLEESLVELGQRFTHHISVWLDAHPNGQIVATLGIGTDGHTAGILPDLNAVRFDSHFEHGLVASYESGDIYRGRVTVTLPFLRQRVSKVIVYVAGNKKQAAFTMLSQSLPLHQAPCGILSQMTNVQLFTDLSN